jgi:hypothetical protein
MEGTMKVTDFRLSCIWVEGARQVLGLQDVGTLGACVQVDNHAPLFNRLLHPDDHPSLTVPWSCRSGKLFRERYKYRAKYVVAELANSPRENRGKKARQAIVPVRRKDHLVKVERAERCFVEGWFYPDGISPTTTCWFRKVQAGYDMTRASFKLQRPHFCNQDDRRSADCYERARRRTRSGMTAFR